MKVGLGGDHRLKAQSPSPLRRGVCALLQLPRTTFENLVMGCLSMSGFEWQVMGAVLWT